MLATIARYGRPYRRSLRTGLGAAVLVVAIRLAMPWPLRGIVEVMLPSRHHGHPRPSLTAWLPQVGDPVLWLAATYLLLALATGLAEMVQRVRMKQYATAVVHDLRADVVRSVARGGASTSSGDLIARIIGDSARIKEGLSGILVHLSQNGLLFLGACAVFLVLHPTLGLVFVAGGLASIWVGIATASSVAAVARAQRSNEGRFAEKLRDALRHGDLGEASDAANRKSAAGDVRTTKLITRSAVLVHAVFGATVGAGLIVGAVAVRNEAMEAGALFLFIAYALMLHRRIVQVGRQIARSGKVLAASGRLAALLGEGGSPCPGPPEPEVPDPLRTALRVEASGVAPGGPIAVAAGSRVAVLGESREQVARLLAALAGREGAARVEWDGAELSPEDLAARVAYLAPAPVLPRVRLWRLLGLAGPWLLDDAQKKTLKRIGAWRVVKASPGRLKARIRSEDLTADDARALALGGALLGDASVLVLDLPLDGAEAEARRRRAKEILRRSEGRTLVMSMAEPVKLGRFDRVLVIEASGVVRDGTPAAFEAARRGEVG